MSGVSDNDDAPQPNHALVASLLPTIRPPKALDTPDGHTKRATAQLVIGKTLSLCLMAGPTTMITKITAKRASSVEFLVQTACGG